MHRRDMLGIFAAAALGLAVLPGNAIAQDKPQKPIKETLVGAWTLLLSDGIKADDGTHVPMFGPNPMGTLIFTPNGHYSLQVMRASRPAFASKSRLTGSADENKAAITGMLTSFGIYTVDEGAKTVTFRIEGSSFPNFDGAKQTRQITAITDEVLTYNNPTPSAPGPDAQRLELVWKKLK